MFAGFVPFSGNSVRLDGRKKKTTSESSTTTNETLKPAQEYVRGIPDRDYQIGTLRFIRGKPKKTDADKDQGDSNGFEAFGGEGNSLRQTKKR